MLSDGEINAELIGSVVARASWAHALNPSTDAESGSDLNIVIGSLSEALGLLIYQLHRDNPGMLDEMTDHVHSSIIEHIGEIAAEQLTSGSD